MANAGSRQTPLPYLPDDAERIRQMVATPGAKIVCPLGVRSILTIASLPHAQ